MMKEDKIETAILALEDKIATLNTWELVFVLLVAVGVVGEFVIGFRHWRLDGQLTALRNEQDKSRTLEIAQANARALEAKVELEKYKAPRKLSKEQQTELADALKMYPALSIDVIKYDSTTEVRDCAFFVIAGVKKAGWRTKAFNKFGGGPVDGVWVLTKPGSAIAIKEAATTLVQKLNEFGIVSKEESGQMFMPWENQPVDIVSWPWDRNDVAPIRILVGTKP